MSACLEWGIPFTIQSAYGDLTLNDDTNPLGYFVLVSDGDRCQMGRDLRVTADPLPQADGENLHRSFTEGYQVRLTIALWASKTQVACEGAQLRAMLEELGLHLNSMLNDPGRVFWTPTGLGDQRLLDEARVVALPRPANNPPSVDVTFESPFPYVIDFTQKTEGLVDGVPEYLLNDGNVDTYPVVKVYGPTSAFTIWNSTVGQQLKYDSTLPGASAIGAGDYIEFDFFRNTAFLNGTGARRMAGIDVEASDFWVLAPSVNFVEITGAAADVLWNYSNA